MLIWTLIVCFTGLTLRLEGKHLLLGIITLLKNYKKYQRWVFLLYISIFPLFSFWSCFAFYLAVYFRAAEFISTAPRWWCTLCSCVREKWPRKSRTPHGPQQLHQTLIRSHFPPLSFPPALPSLLIFLSLSSSARGHMQRLCCWNELEKHLILHE